MMLRSSGSLSARKAHLLTCACRDMADRDGVAALPERLVLRLGAPRGRQREVWQGMGSIRTAAPAWLAVHKAPFRLTPETPASSTIRYEASRAELAAWLAEGKVSMGLVQQDSQGVGQCLCALFWCSGTGQRGVCRGACLVPAARSGVGIMC